MAAGDDALSGGMDLVNGSAAGSAAQIDDYINITRDYVANAHTFWKPSVLIPIARGGTGASSASAARSALGVTPANISAIENNGAYWTRMGWNGVRMQFDVPGYVFPTEIASLSDIPGTPDLSSRVAKSGDTMSGALTVNNQATVTGSLFLPNSTAATSGFTVCYINSDGRVSRGSSSRRYKKYIHDAPDLGDLFAAPLREYQMRVDGVVPDDGVKHIGYIAEELVDTDMGRFVVYVNDEVESIDFIALLLAQNAQLNERVAALEAR